MVEEVNEKLKDSIKVYEFIETLFADVCEDQMPREETEFIENLLSDVRRETQTPASKEANEICASILLELAGAALIDSVWSKYRCDECENSFKDKTHLKEHTERMHSQPTPCMICNVVFVDKQSAIVHQKLCTRRCTFPKCEFHTRHKHTFMKHLRGHEIKLRRFRSF